MPFLQREAIVDDQSAFVSARIDRCVQQLAGGSRSHVTGLFDHDCVQLNGSVETDPGRRLNSGDRVSVRFEVNRRYAPVRRPRSQKHRGFSIVLEDQDFIVVDKSAELLTVPTDAREPYTLIYRVNEHVKHQGHRRGAFVVHRLDRGVSGLLVFGKSKEIAERLQQQFQERKPQRQYDALVAGHPEQDKGIFRSHLATGKNLNRFSTCEDQGELAVTHYQVVARLPDVTHVAVQLETGRRNQIRVHFAEARHPVLGDARYRRDLWKDIPWPHKRLALHASTLGFRHPVTDEPVLCHSPLPSEMTGFLRAGRASAVVRQPEGSGGLSDRSGMRGETGSVRPGKSDRRRNRSLGRGDSE